MSLSGFLQLPVKAHCGNWRENVVFRVVYVSLSAIHVPPHCDLPPFCLLLSRSPLTMNVSSTSYCVCTFLLLAQGEMHELRQQFLQFLKYCETVLRDENAAGAVKETVSAWVKPPVCSLLCSGGGVLCSVIVGVSSTAQGLVCFVQCSGECVLCSAVQWLVCLLQCSGGCVLLVQCWVYPVPCCICTCRLPMPSVTCC